MHGNVLAGVCVCALALAGCRTNQQRCKEIVDQLCERVHECTTTKDALFQARFGTDVEDCKTDLYANPLQPTGSNPGIACDNADTVQKLCDNLGYTFAQNFDDAKAQECHDAREAMSCTEYLAQFDDPTAVPLACTERCSQ